MEACLRVDNETLRQRERGKEKDNWLDRTLHSPPSIYCRHASLLAASSFKTKKTESLAAHTYNYLAETLYALL